MWTKNMLRRGEGLKLESWLPFIQEVGFPVVVTFYLLHRIETKLDSVIDSIQMLPTHMKAEPQYQSKKTV
jgi:hypothetical protein